MTSWKNLPIYIKSFVLLTPPVAGAMLYRSLDEVPYTNRKRLVLLSAKAEEAMGTTTFRQILRAKENEILPDSHPKSKMVRKVGERIAKATERRDFRWEFVVIDSPEVNAFVLPGGKVCVYSGLFKVLKNEDSLAAVLSHEAGHAVARHVAERLTLQNLFSLFLWTVNPTAVDLSHAIYTLGVELPFSRKFESEADEIGLHLMVKACYNPMESLRVFERLALMDDGLQLKYLSTHPPNTERVATLRKLLRYHQPE